MEILKELFAFLINTERGFSTKAAIFISLLLAVILVNNLFGFSYYYDLSNRLDKVSTINKLLQDSITSSENKVALVAMRDKIINRETIPEKISALFANTYKRMKNSQSPTNRDRVIIESEDSQDMPVYQPPRDNFWFAITSSGFYILVLIILIPVCIIFGLQTPNTLNFILGTLIASAVMYSLAAFNYYLFGLIPLIRNNWVWNYILNFVLQILIWLVFGFVVLKSKRIADLK